MKASEKQLIQSFEREKEKVAQLNQEIIRLNQKLQEKSEIFNDSLENNTATHTVHFKIESNTASMPTIEVKTQNEKVTNKFVYS